MKSTLRRSLIVLALALLALALAACGRAEPTPTALPTSLPGATPTETPTAVTGDAWARAQAAGKLVVGTSADYPPFEYYDQNFAVDGFDIALIRAIGQRLGLQVEIKDFAFDGLGGALHLGQIDLAISAISVTPEREALVDFSNIYYVSVPVALARSDAQFGQIQQVEELAGMTVGVQRGSVYETWARANLLEPGILGESDLYIYGDMNQAIKDLQRGRVDVVLLDRPVAQDYVAQGGVKIVAEGLQQQQYAMAMAKGQTALQRVVNQALGQVRDDGTVAQLVEQYLGIDEEDIVPVPTPTAVPPTATPAPPAAVATATPIPPCIDGMAWVADLTFDDSNGPQSVPPGQPFVKAWRVRNSGACTWDSSYFLGYDRGNVPAAQMGGQPVPVVGAVSPGATYDFEVNLVAPLTPGEYQGFWQMRNGRGVAFGETIWVAIRVPAAPTPTPLPTQTPSPSISFTVDRTQIQAGECVTFSWAASNVRAVFFYAQGEAWQNGGVAGQGSRTVCPSQTTTYYLRVENMNGSVETREITIYVQPAASAPLIARFSADPQQIAVGQCTNLAWDVQGSVNQVTVSRNNTAIWDGAPVRGNMQDCPPGAGAMTYGLRAAGPGGTSQAVQHVTVAQPTPAPPTSTPAPATATPAPTTPPEAPQPIINAFTVNPTQVSVGQCVILAWTTSGGTQQVRLKRGDIIVLDNAPLDGSVQDCLNQPGTVRYTLEASNLAGTTLFSDVTVNVTSG